MRRFRRFRKPFRRRRRWDMQTFRLCESVGEFKDGFQGTCNFPHTDLVKILAPTGGALGTEASLGQRGLMFGGGLLRLRVNAAIIDSDLCPCSHAVHMVNALVVLPLLEDGVTPAYIPTLTGTRTFDSATAVGNSDKDEDVLWWHDEQLDVLNLACSNSIQNLCPIRSSGTNCSVDTISDVTGAPTEAHASALYGRFVIEHRVRVKRRLQERQALFLATAFFSGIPFDFDECPTWPFRLNVYLRYAVRTF